MQEQLTQLEDVIDQLIERLNAQQIRVRQLEDERQALDRERTELKDQCQDANARIDSIIEKVEVSIEPADS